AGSGAASSVARTAPRCDGRSGACGRASSWCAGRRSCRARPPSRRCRPRCSRSAGTGGDDGFAVATGSCLPPAVPPAELEMEAFTFTRYLVGRPPPPELVARYCEANATLFTTPVAPIDAALVAFVRRHPWSVGILDAAVGLRRPGSLLRNKILVMTAILETSPAFADEFLTPPVRPVVLALRVAALGTLAVARTVLGLVLYP